MPRQHNPPYYRYGSQTYPYEANWAGRPWPNARAATTRALGDVTRDTEFFEVPARGDPYLLHAAEQGHPSMFRVPRSASPYAIHKAQQVELEPGGPTGGLGFLPQLSRMEKTAALVGVAALGAWFFFRKKRGRKGRRR